LRLADALGAVDVALAQSRPLPEPGWLVVVEGDLSRTRRAALSAARIIESFAAPASPAAGEFARLAWQGVGAGLAALSRALATVRRYFAREGFIEVPTPVRVRVPGSDPNVEAFRAEQGFLITSPEHHMKRLLVGGVPRLYQVVPASRKEELGPLHEPEFLMLEWYRAFAGLELVMQDTERLVLAVVEELGAGAGLRLDGRRVEVRAPFERLALREAFRRYAGIQDAVDLAASDEVRFFEVFVDRVEPALARRRRPVFLCEFPATQAALARRSVADPAVAERFELYISGVELCNGYGELTDAAEFERRWRAERTARRARRRPTYPLDAKLLAALEEGMPPSAGNALGIERLVALACGHREVARVRAFPASRI
jgi:lysyl-tRNA synthetase class 2